jgi:hypothetical protein
MSASRRLGLRWNDDELIVVLDLHINQDMHDGHHHDTIAKCMGRYSSGTNSHKDGPVNRKLAEVIGLLNASRAAQHPGRRIIELVKKYKNSHTLLRKDAINAWKNILGGHTGQVPPEVQSLLN